MNHNHSFDPLTPFLKSPFNKNFRSKNKKKALHTPFPVQFFNMDQQTLFKGIFSFPSSKNCVVVQQKVNDGFNHSLFWLFFTKNNSVKTNYDRYGFYISSVDGVKKFMIKTTLYTNIVDPIKLLVKNSNENILIHQNLSLSLSHSFYLPLIADDFYNFHFQFPYTQLRFSLQFINAHSY